MSAGRMAEIVVGLALVGYAVRAVRTGLVLGRTRTYTRQQEPWRFWAIIAAACAVGVAFLWGAVSWRT